MTTPTPSPLGRIGLWTAAFESLPAPAVRDLIAEVDALGFGAVWIPEAVTRDAIANSMLLLGASERIAVATGIANIYARDPYTMQASWQTVSEAHPGRFVLGLGVSHAPMVEDVRHHTYGPPLATMRAYLDAMDSALYLAPPPPVPPQRVLAALGPKMLALAAERTDGAHPYFVPPEHTAIAREVMGPDALLAPEQKVVLESDPVAARAIAREAMAMYLTLPNYVNNLLRLGFTTDDVEQASDRLVDAIVVWGDVEAVRARVQAHVDAGADHVCLQTLPYADHERTVRDWRTLADALL